MVSSSREQQDDRAPDGAHRRPASVWPLVQTELHRIAEAHFRRQPPGHTLQPTALLHEAYLRLADETRGGGMGPVTLVDSVTPAAEGTLDMLDLESALGRLGEFDERKARVVELRVFAGLTIEETAAALGVSHMTVSSDWRMARAWLQRELESGR